MSEPGGDESDSQKAIQKLWDFAHEHYRSQGIDFGQLLRKLAAKQVEQLTPLQGREDFHELCGAGCTPEVLGVILFLIRIASDVEDFWTFMVGDPDRRHKVTRTLENAAQELDHFFAPTTDASSRPRFQEKERARFADVGHLDPSTLAAELRFYSTILNLADVLASDTEARNIAEVLKYALAAYVDRATGRPHHKNVAGLLADLSNPPVFTEEAQRMWINRHYSRLDAHFSKIVDFLFDAGCVIASQQA